jgi:hypothetical protein
MGFFPRSHFQVQILLGRLSEEKISRKPYSYPSPAWEGWGVAIISADKDWRCGSRGIP